MFFSIFLFFRLYQGFPYAIYKTHHGKSKVLLFLYFLEGEYREYSKNFQLSNASRKRYSSGEAELAM